MRLVSMADFVLEINKEFENPTKIFDKNKQFEIILNCAKFLKQPLVLGMFVPCDLGGNVLEEPIYSTNHSDDCYCTECENETKRCSDEQQKYQQAKERVLFEGFRIENCTITNDIIGIGEALTLYNTVEDLLIDFKGDITLTKSAKKQLGL